jgi:CBS domain-containing protein
MREVEKLFFKHRIGHLPILDNEKLVGIVTRWDLLEYKKHRKGLEIEDVQDTNAIDMAVK